MKKLKHLAGREEPVGRKFGQRVVNEAKKQGVPIEGQSLSAAEQQRLLAEDGAPSPLVQGDKFLARFVKPVFEKDEDDRFVELEFSVALSDAHKELVESQVLNAWKYLERNHAKSVVGIEIPNQTVDLHLAPDTEAELHLSNLQVRKVTLSRVEASGEGKAQEIMRLQFRLVADATKNVVSFATGYFSEAVWLRMSAAQGVLAEAS